MRLNSRSQATKKLSGVTSRALCGLTLPLPHTCTSGDGCNDRVHSLYSRTNSDSVSGRTSSGTILPALADLQQLARSASSLSYKSLAAGSASFRKGGGLVDAPRRRGRQIVL